MKEIELLFVIITVSIADTFINGSLYIASIQTAHTIRIIAVESKCFKIIAAKFQVLGQNVVWRFVHYQKLPALSKHHFLIGVRRGRICVVCIDAI